MEESTSTAENKVYAIPALLKNHFSPEKTDYGFLKLSLAPKFPSLEYYLTDTNRNIKVMISGVIRLMGKNIQIGLNYKTLKKIFSGNPLTTLISDSEKNVSCFYSLENMTNLEQSSLEVYAWFGTTFGPEVLESSGLNSNIFLKILNMLQKAFQEFQTVSMDDLKLEKEFLDIGVLQYPDKQKDYFLLFQLGVKGVIEKSSGGIKASLAFDLNQVKYGPNNSVIEGMKEEIKTQAETEFNDHFTNINIVTSN
jgi:hypothetical protein